MTKSRIVAGVELGSSKIATLISQIIMDPVTQETSVTYFSIPPGNYTFSVKACNNDGLWNTFPATFSFAITPPFWRTWWFYLLCVLLITGILYGIIKTRERNLQKEKRMLTDEVKGNILEIAEQKEKIEKLRDDLTATTIELKHIKTHNQD